MGGGGNDRRDPPGLRSVLVVSHPLDSGSLRLLRRTRRVCLGRSHQSAGPLIFDRSAGPRRTLPAHARGHLHRGAARGVVLGRNRLARLAGPRARGLDFSPISPCYGIERLGLLLTSSGTAVPSWICLSRSHSREVVILSAG